MTDTEKLQEAVRLLEFAYRLINERGQSETTLKQIQAFVLENKR